MFQSSLKIATIAAIAALSLPVYGVVSSRHARTVAQQADIFPMAQEVQTRVHFWERIFLKYPATSVVLHDPDNSSLIIDIIDFNAFAKKKILRSLMPVCASGLRLPT